ncbi:hypothetical protein CBL_00232 [Carabus blaptoides fortunei]
MWRKRTSNRRAGSEAGREELLSVALEVVPKNPISLWTVAKGIRPFGAATDKIDTTYKKTEPTYQKLSVQSVSRVQQQLPMQNVEDRSDRICEANFINRYYFIEQVTTMTELSSVFRVVVLCIDMEMQAGRDNAISSCLVWNGERMWINTLLSQRALQATLYRWLFNNCLQIEIDHPSWHNRVPVTGTGPM